MTSTMACALVDAASRTVFSSEMEKQDVITLETMTSTLSDRQEEGPTAKVVIVSGGPLNNNSEHGEEKKGLGSLTIILIANSEFNFSFIPSPLSLFFYQKSQSR